MTGERTWRLGRRPALDGVRAIAVLLVVGCHGHVPGIPTAGAVGVVAFLTLSGFLITSLLVEEVARDGGADGEDHRVVAAAELLAGDLDPDVHPGAEEGSLGHHLGDPSVPDRLPPPDTGEAVHQGTARRGGPH